MKILLALTFSLIVSFSVVAQAEPPTCTMTDINAVIISMLGDLSTLQIAALDEDLTAALDVLAILDERVHSLQTACAETSPDAGLTFSGSGSHVTDVFEIPPGTYRVRGEFVPEDQRSTASVTLARLSGSCALAMVTTTYLFGSYGEPQETLLQSAGCEALLQIDGEMREWTITFDLIR